MAAAKTNLFTDQQNRIAELAKALGHPARIAILQLLAKRGCVCGEIVDVLPLSQSTVSQHLRELKKVGIIQGEVEGVKICYCINPTVWEEIKLVFGTFFQEKGSCC